MNTVQTIPVKQSHTFPDEAGYFDGAGVALTLLGTHRHYSIFGWDATGEGRVVQNGPMVSGPIAYANERATVIALHSIPESDTFIEVVDGDRLRFRDDVFEVHVDRGQWIELHHVGSYEFTPAGESE